MVKPQKRSDEIHSFTDLNKHEFATKNEIDQAQIPHNMVSLRQEHTNGFTGRSNSLFIETHNSPPFCSFVFRLNLKDGATLKDCTAGIRHWEETLGHSPTGPSGLHQERRVTR